MTRPLIYPVIHHQLNGKTLEQADVARDCGADGVFLISHHGKDADILALSQRIGTAMPGFKVGVNLLSMEPEEVVAAVEGLQLDMLWFDNAGISSAGLSVHRVRALLPLFQTKMELFAGVAFKHQDPEPGPPKAVKLALQVGFIPTTSGPTTGVAIDLKKARAMSAVAKGKLAVASGMTPENVGRYAGLFGAILVSTGICNRDEEIMPTRLRALIANAAVQETAG